MLQSAVLAWLALTATSYAQFGVEHTQYGTSPPVYPSPSTNGTGGWDDALEKAKAFLKELTLDEKAFIATGVAGPCVGNIAPIPRLNFSGLCFQDGPNGIRQAVYASFFPAGITVGATWDRSLAKARGFQIAEEFRDKGSHAALGPVVGPLGRSPFGGRNWENFSPDVYLSGELVGQTVVGIQSAGVQAVTKHFLGNEQEQQRMPSTVDGVTVDALSSNIDDKTMHESYLWPFANAVKAGTASVMCSYQRLNGSYGCQNSKVLNGLLKKELGFQGYVVSDWMATHAGVAGIEAGQDMDMPGGIGFSGGPPSMFGGNISTAVTNSSLALERVDDMVLRIMTPYFHLGQDVEFPILDESTTVAGIIFPRKDWNYNFTFGPTVDVRGEHAKIIREIGAAGAVLLKNVNNTLPLQEPKNIGVFGNDAADLTEGLYSIPLYNSQLDGANYDIGTLPGGGGSGTGRFTNIVSPLDAIKDRAESYGAFVQYITSNTVIAKWGISSLAPKPDVCLVFLKAWVTEGYDRTSLLAEWNSTVVVDQVASNCANTVVVIHGGAPTLVPWKDHPNVTAILAAHLPGEETGNSIVDVLWGEVNPSGRLPYTIANEESDYNRNLVNSTELLESTNPYAWQADFTEGNLIEYKEFDAANKSVAYEFGFGLSYTTFELSDLQIQSAASNASRVPSPTARIIPGGNEELWETIATVSATVTNTGEVDGAAVPQLYVSFPTEAGENTPVRSLRGFDKILLTAGESSTVKFPLMRRDLSYWDVVAQTWTLPSSSIGVDVGFSSRDLILSGELTV